MKLKLEAGERLNRSPNEPIIDLVKGARPYLWIGNDADGDRACFATLSSLSAMRKLATAMLEAVEKAKRGGK